MAGSRTGIWLTIISALAFASSGSFVKAVLDAGWSPGAALAVRLTGAAVIVLALAVATDRRGLRDSLAHRRVILGFGVVGVAGVQATFFLALQTLQVGVALMIQFLAPVAVIGWHWLVGGRRPNAVTAAGAAVALAGAALVVDVFHGGGIDVSGLSWAGLSMVCNAAFFLLSERTATEVGPVALLGTGFTVAAVTAWLLAATGLLPARFGAGSVILAEVRLPTAVSFAALILIATVVAYLAGVAGAARIGATLMSLVLLSEVLFAVAMSWLLVGEAVTPVQMIGGVVVIVGIALARRGGDRARARPETTAATPVPT